MQSSKLTRILTIMANCVFHLIILLSRRLHFNYNFKRYKKGDKAKRVDILFSSFLMNWRNYTHKNGKTYEYDLMLGDIIEEAENQYNIICIDVVNKIRPIQDTLKKFNQSEKWICYEEFITLLDIFNAVIFYIRRALGYINNPDMDRFFTIADREPTVLGYLNLIIAKTIVTEINPKIIILTCEDCYSHRELVYFARLMGKKTIAVQHGELEKDRFFFKDTLKRFILPDITCLFGKKYYDVLIKKSIYKPNMLAITGNPRYDILFFTDRIYSKQNIKEKYNIDPKKKIILWITQTHGLKLDENIKNIKTVYSAMRFIPDAQLIIKLHPGEDQNHLLYNRNKSYNPIIIGGKEDTYCLLHISDLVITRHSTTGLEAIALNKPLIVLNLSGEPDIINYVIEGVAIGVYYPNNLRSTILKLLHNDKELKKNREKYIIENLYKMDGKATKRVVNIITDLMSH